MSCDLQPREVPQLDFGFYRCSIILTELLMIAMTFHIMGYSGFLLVTMVIVGRRFKHQDGITIVMVLVVMIAGIVPMLLF